IIVVGDAAPMTEALVDGLAHIRVGDPTDQDTLVGPVINQAACDDMHTAVADAQRAGGEVAATAGVPTGEGFYVAPTIIRSLSPDHRVAREETFAPLAVFLEARTVDEAVALSNSVRYGLVTSILGSVADALLSEVSGVATG